MRGIPIILLLISNVFMTFAWYAHLRDDRSTPVWIVVLVSWLIAFFEYCFQVPANRIGMSQGYTLAQLKVVQEVLSVGVFIVFYAVYFHAPIRWNHAVGFSLVAAGAVFVFKPW
ncbi:MAG: DMT family protein [Deltaproteobacteria bacterium]|nr:DMT family protein [Deltaproteobacteria bacterium]